MASDLTLLLHEEATGSASEDNHVFNLSLSQGALGQNMDEAESLLEDFTDLSAELVSYSLLDGSEDLLLDASTDVFFGSKGGSFRRQWDQSPYLSSPRSISATRLPSSIGSLSTFNKLLGSGLTAEAEALSSSRVADAASSRTRAVHDSWHVSRPKSSYPCGILSPSSRETRPRLNLFPSLTTIHDEPEPENGLEDDAHDYESNGGVHHPSSRGSENGGEYTPDWHSKRTAALESIDEHDEGGDNAMLASPAVGEGSSHDGLSRSGHDVAFSRVPSGDGGRDGVDSTEDETEGSDHSFSPCK